MDRKQLIARIEKRWDAFNQALEGLTDRQMKLGGVSGDWSVRDVIGHITTWEDETLKALRLLIEADKPPRYAGYGGIDAFNEQQRQAKANLTPVRLGVEFGRTHQRLLTFLASVPESWFETETRFRHRLRLDTWGHYPEHTEAILAWRRAKGL